MAGVKKPRLVPSWPHDDGGRLVKGIDNRQNKSNGVRPPNRPVDRAKPLPAPRKKKRR